SPSQARLAPCSRWPVWRCWPRTAGPGAGPPDRNPTRRSGAGSDSRPRLAPGPISGRGARLGLGHPLHQLRLALGRLVLVDDALGRGHVEGLDGLAHRGLGVLGGVGGGAVGVLDARLQLRTHRLVLLVAAGVRQVAFLLALDVGHAYAYSKALKAK